MTHSVNHNRRTVSCQRFIEISKSFFVDADFEGILRNLGLTSIDSVFSYSAGKSLAKKNLATFRSRLQLETDSLGTALFLKRYNRPPALVQLMSWLSHRSRKSFGLAEFASANQLSAAGVNTPKTVAYGEQRGVFFEKRSFVITERIPNAESLERKLPAFFAAPATPEKLKLRRNFIARLAAFIRKFHQTNYRHRDLYFSHIFYDDSGTFYLIDLARAFKPLIWRERFRIKDIAQLYYSAPGAYFSGTDRLRFYLGYAQTDKVTGKDKSFIRKVVGKAQQMARRNARHGSSAPFAN
jgi:heptose I phosphotransferase